MPRIECCGCCLSMKNTNNLSLKRHDGSILVVHCHKKCEDNVIRRYKRKFRLEVVR